MSAADVAQLEEALVRGIATIEALHLALTTNAPADVVAAERVLATLAACAPPPSLSVSSSGPAPPPPRDRTEALTQALHQAQWTSEFQLGCLRDPIGYRYAYPNMTLDTLARLRVVLAGDARRLDHTGAGGEPPPGTMGRCT